MYVYMQRNIRFLQYCVIIKSHICVSICCTAPSKSSYFQYIFLSLLVTTNIVVSIVLSVNFSTPGIQFRFDSSV